MVEPITDAYAPIVQFGIPLRERRSYSGGAVLLLAACVALAAFWPAAVGVKVAACLGVAVAAVALLLLALRVDDADLDMSGPAYRRRHGIWPVIREQAVVLDEPRVLLSTSDHANTSDGFPAEEYHAWIKEGERHLPMMRGWRGAHGPEFTSIIAQRLGSVVEPVDRAAVLGRRRFSPGPAIMWAAAASLFGLMFWPVLSGKRPLRPVWASGVGGNMSGTFGRGQASFQDGIDQYRDGKFEEAERTFRRALEEGMDQAEGHNMLAYAQAGRGHLDAALETARKALSLSPESGNILDTVGEVHELRKEFEPAAEYYKKALKKITDEPPTETHAKLGRTLHALGRRSEAIKHLQEAAKYPGHRYGRAAAALLQSLGVTVPYPAKPPRTDLNSNPLRRT